MVECMTDALPADVQRILEDVAAESGKYRSLATGRIRLQWPDEHKLKWDMTEKRHRWLRERAPIAAIKIKCLELAFTPRDTDTIVDLVRKAQTRHIFRPDPRYKGTYPYPIE